MLTWHSREFLSLFMTYLNISGRKSVYNEVDFPGVLVGVKVAVGVDVLDAVIVGLKVAVDVGVLVLVGVLVDVTVKVSVAVAVWVGVGVVVAV
jgi:hypothetical protein